MKIVIGLLVAIIFLSSCGGSKKAVKSVYKVHKASARITSKQAQVVRFAQKQIGVPYKYGGTTRKGMDCSGLVYTSFQQVNVSLPRVSYEMSKKGKSISEKNIEAGDLVFFKTVNKSRKPINHVGLVSKVVRGTIYFIHSSSSKGVIESSTKNPYWNKTYKFAKRVL